MGGPHNTSRSNPRAAELGHCPKVGVEGQKSLEPCSPWRAPLLPARLSALFLALVLGENGFLILGYVIICEKCSKCREGRGSGEECSRVVVLFGTKFAPLHPLRLTPPPNAPQMPQYSDTALLETRRYFQFITVRFCTQVAFFVVQLFSRIPTESCMTSAQATVWGRGKKRHWVFVLSCFFFKSLCI